LNTTSSFRALILDFSLFLLSGLIIWAVNIIGQSAFPGNNLFPFFVRLIILMGSLALSYYLNYKFIRRNVLTGDFLKFRLRSIKRYLNGSILACLVIATIWAIVYLIYPFEIIKNGSSKTNLPNDIISYSLGNTLEELLFRGFLLIASIKLFGKIGGVFFISLLFALFHLQGTGLTREGISMVMTTFTMSLLFIAVIYYTNSIWTAVMLHITGNLLLHTLGFDGANGGMFQIKFATSNMNGGFISFIFEVVVITFVLLIFFKAKRNINCC
jgi:membrane protease YdiL (CAAX protease family)